MKGGYGSGAHDSKVEDYASYKEKQYKRFNSEVNNIIQNIKDTSLMESDKIELIEQLAENISIRVTITKKIL